MRPPPGWFPGYPSRCTPPGHSVRGPCACRANAETGLRAGDTPARNRHSGDTTHSSLAPRESAKEPRLCPLLASGIWTYEPRDDHDVREKVQARTEAPARPAGRRSYGDGSGTSPTPVGAVAAGGCLFWTTTGTQVSRGPADSGRRLEPRPAAGHAVVRGRAGTGRDPDVMRQAGGTGDSVGGTTVTSVVPTADEDYRLRRPARR